MSQEGRSFAELGAAGWVSLAAAPTFAAMSLLTALLGGGVGMCSAARPSPLAGMALMYLLMAVFHSPAWLRLISSRSWAGALRTRRR
jgi:hypothetical protein